MTTNFIKTTGIPLYKFAGETYCKMIDVLKLIHHEEYELFNDERYDKLKDIFDRIEMRLTKNDFLLPDAEKPKEIQRSDCPCRYGVGYYDKEGNWHFFVATNNGKDIFSSKPCEAKMYLNYRDAQACSDFLEEDTMVLDFEASMSEEDRWLRELRMPMPYDADEGNENSVPVEVVT